MTKSVSTDCISCGRSVDEVTFNVADELNEDAMAVANDGWAIYRAVPGGRTGGAACGCHWSESDSAGWGSFTAWMRSLRQG